MKIAVQTDYISVFLQAIEMTVALSNKDSEAIRAVSTLHCYKKNEMCHMCFLLVNNTNYSRSIKHIVKYKSYMNSICLRNSQFLWTLLIDTRSEMNLILF